MTQRVTTAVKDDIHRALLTANQRYRILEILPFHTDGTDADYLRGKRATNKIEEEVNIKSQSRSFIIRGDRHTYLVTTSNGMFGGVTSCQDTVHVVVWADANSANKGNQVYQSSPRCHKTINLRRC